MSADYILPNIATIEVTSKCRSRFLHLLYYDDHYLVREYLGRQVFAVHVYNLTICRRIQLSHFEGLQKWHTRQSSPC